MAEIRTLIVDHGRDRGRRRKTEGPRAPRGGRGSPDGGPLKEIDGFGPNPGALAMLAYAPPGLPAGAPLVVVLHGCTQNARDYEVSAGWCALADELGFAVVYPEQRKANNALGCFNWFLPADAARGLGESRSIREMVEFAAKRWRSDRARIFVNGLSAGGAMTSMLLADYPELFSAGAIIAGLPCGAATGMQEAFREMSNPAAKTPQQLGDLVRAGSPHKGPWPRVAVLHGSKDATVAPKNADQIVKQWVDVHGATLRDFEESFVSGHRRRVWRVGGRAMVESITIAGMGHGAPLDARLGEAPAPYMLDVGLSSTRRIADFFGIEGALREAPEAEDGAAAERGAQTAWSSTSAGRGSWTDASWFPKSGQDSERRERNAGRIDIGAVISKALRAAGLMK